jgi:hypothetical protein
MSIDLRRINKSLIDVVMGRAKLSDPESQYGLGHLQQALNNTAAMKAAQRADERAERVTAWENRVHGEYAVYSANENFAKLASKKLDSEEVDASSEWYDPGEGFLSKGNDPNSTPSCQACFHLTANNDGKMSYTGEARAVLQMIKHANDKDKHGGWHSNPFYNPTQCFNDAASKILECFDAGNKEAAIAEYNKFALSQGKPTIKAFLNKMKF